jgi:hypothetical protein
MLMKQRFMAALALLIASIAVACSKPKRMTPRSTASAAVERPADTVSPCIDAPFIGPAKCVDGKWVADGKAATEEWMMETKLEKHRADLYFAMRSRVLTKKEMSEVVDYGESLTTPLCFNGCFSYPEQERRAFNDALLQQFKLRVAAGQATVRALP